MRITDLNRFTMKVTGATLMLVLGIAGSGGIAAASAAASADTHAGTHKATSREISASTTKKKAVRTLRVALVAPSAINDLAFTESMYSALEDLKKTEHLKISVSDTEYVVSTAAQVIRQYASKGYNLVICHGSQYGSIVEQVAPKFPKVSFAWGTAAATFGLHNVFGYEAASNQGGYVQGYIAEMMSKSKVLGPIGPIATGDAKLYIDGFVAGAKAAAAAAKSKVTVRPVYTGSFSTDSLMATAARTFVSDGADVLTGSSQSVVGAIGVARSDGLPWFSTQWTQASIAPKNVVASQIYNWKPVLIQIFTDIRARKLGGVTYTINLGNDGEKIALNPRYDLRKFPLTHAIRAKTQKLIKAITDGTISPPQ